MSAEFRLPDLGEGLPEAEIVQWLVAVGDTVTLNQPIAEVETAKAIVELPSPFAGTVRSLHAQAGEVVAVGELLIAIDEPAVAGAPTDDAAASLDEVVPPNLVGYGAAPRATGRPQRRTRSAATPRASDTAVLEAAPHDVLPSSPPDVLHERPRSTPPVRALAKRLGVDLALVAASGVSGIIRREDVERFAAESPVEEPASAPAAEGARSAPGPERATRVPIRGIRRHTAEAMVQSAFTAPHVTCFLEVDVTETTQLLADFRADRRLEGHRIGVLAVVAKAVCLALRHEPALNSRWDQDAGEIVHHHYVNLGIAAATDRGLIVPNVPDADRRTLVELADAIGELAMIARSGRTPLSAMTGGTFSITNFGVFGVDAGTPILNPGEAGILGVGAVRSRPWEYRGEIALRDVLTLSLSFDHRLADGEQGARFLAAVGDVLRAPGRAMLLG